MYVGKFLLVKHNGKIKEGKVIKIFPEDLQLELIDGTKIIRKFWETRTLPEK